MQGCHRQPSDASSWLMAAKRDVRQPNQKSQNEPGMSFGINETEKRGAEGSAWGRIPFVLSAVNTFIVNMLRRENGVLAEVDCFYHTAGTTLTLQIEKLQRSSAT